jgi:hypothetical protein
MQLLVQLKFYHRWAENRENAHMIATKHDHAINNVGHKMTIIASTITLKCHFCIFKFKMHL